MNSKLAYNLKALRDTKCFTLIALSESIGNEIVSLEHRLKNQEYSISTLKDGLAQAEHRDLASKRQILALEKKRNKAERELNVRDIDYAVQYAKFTPEFWSTVLPFIQHFAEGGEIEHQADDLPWLNAGTSCSFVPGYEYRKKDVPLFIYQISRSTPYAPPRTGDYMSAIVIAPYAPPRTGDYMSAIVIAPDDEAAKSIHPDGLVHSGTCSEVANVAWVAWFAKWIDRGSIKCTKLSAYDPINGLGAGAVIAAETFNGDKNV